MRTNEKARQRNRTLRSRLRTAVKDVRAEVTPEQAVKKLLEAQQLLDKAASTGLIHKKNADRNKSRLAHAVKKLAQPKA
jgi:small subunit ribosomal protein S20